MSGSEAVAADMNLIRQSTTRRYLSVMEELRGRRPAILPTVDIELVHQLPFAAAAEIRSLGRKIGKWSDRKIAFAAMAAGEAAGEWWEEERTRNSTAYMRIPSLGDLRYAKVGSALPDDAFMDKNTNDQIIYAQALVHEIDVLASRNRRTILRKRLDRHFAGLGYPQAPVSIRNLYEHTISVAAQEGRSESEVALETILCAVVPEDWTPDETYKVRHSCTRFIRNLEVSVGRGEAAPDGENELVFILKKALGDTARSEFTRLCGDAYARRPAVARDTELRYRDRTRAAVRGTGIDLWE